MVLESTIVCIDNGEFMRNGDFVPTRMQAQIEAVNLLVQCKLRANPESVVGVLTMAPKVDVQVGLTQDSAKLMAKLHQVNIKGFADFLVGIRTAQLVLKLRRNRNHKTRIVLFVGSPIEEPIEALVDVAKKLKKDKFQVDIVSFGESTVNSEKLDTFIKTINGSDTGSHLITVPAGASLQEVLLESAILRSEDGAAPAVTFGAGGGFDFGIDPNEDPELAMALRVSLEEQRQRQEQHARQTTDQVVQPPAATVPPVSDERPQDVEMDSVAAMTEEEQMELALRMSMMPSVPQTSQSESCKIQSGVQQTDNAGQGSSDVIMNDPQALEALLNTLPGVDTKSDAFRKAKDEAENKKKEKDSTGENKK